MARVIEIHGDHGGATQAAAVRRSFYRSLNVVSPLALVLLWEVMARLHVLDVRFFPPPSSIMGTLFEMVLSGELLRHLGISLGRIVGGFIVGALPGLMIGLAMGLSPLVRAILQPIMASLYPIPKLAILPLIILIFGLGEASKIAIIAVGVFFQVLINTVAGVMNIDRIYLDVAKNLGARKVDFYWTVALPGALPVIFAGLSVAMGSAFLLIVAAEFVGANSGVGYLLWNSWQIMQLDVMYSGLITVSASGYAMSLLLNTIEATLVPWRQRR